MLESIIESTKVELGQKLSENDVADNQLDNVLSLAQDSILNNFKSSATDGGLNNILNLFNGRQSIQSSPMVNNIISDYAGQLISKLGFAESTAKSISGMVIPFIMNMINTKTPNSGLSNNDIGSLLGNGALDGIQKGVLGTFKNLF